MSEQTQAYEAPCPECGAPRVNGMSCWEMLGMLLAWDCDDPALQAEHFLTVACSNLQHPAQLSEATLAGLGAVFIEKLDYGLAVADSSPCRQGRSRHDTGAQAGGGAKARAAPVGDDDCRCLPT
jgi:hypothetical protein